MRPAEIPFLAQAIENLITRLTVCDNEPQRAVTVQFREELTSAGAPHSLIHNLNLADWLACQPGYRKFYWRSRDGQFEVATLGIARSYQDSDAIAWLESGQLYSSPLTYYWISGFDPCSGTGSDSGSGIGSDIGSGSGSSESGGWEHFPKQLLFLPQIELRRKARQIWLSVNLSPGTMPGLLIRLLKQLRLSVGPATAFEPVPLCLTDRQDFPSQAVWRETIARAQQQFAQGHLQKVVLARKTSLQNASELSLWSVFHQWRQEAVNCYQIVLQLTPTAGFISFTPERLYRRDGSAIVTEALAGTLPLPRPLSRHLSRPLSPAPEGDDPTLADAPEVDSKNRYEHALVIGDITEKLKECCVSVNSTGATGLLRQRNIQHLHHPIQALLKRPDLDAELLRSLHPTAAIGGLPMAAAKRFIADQEVFSRGWYAGCCGPISARKSELAIGIRSAQVVANQLHLFAGAGIVPGSEADREWQELEQKIALPLSLFDGAVKQSINHAQMSYPQSSSARCNTEETHVPDSASVA